MKKKILQRIWKYSGQNTHDFREESILFISVLKWVTLATLVGIIVGFATTIFLKLLDLSISLGSKTAIWYFLPISFLLSVLITKKYAPEAEGHGTEKVIKAIHKNSGLIDIKVVPVKILTTIITIATGGSAGKEGPSAQIGAALSSWFSNFLKFDAHDRKKLVICGISAGFAAVFGTPIAGAIFGIEVLFVGSIFYEALLPSFIAGIISYKVATSLGIVYIHSPLAVIPLFNNVLFFELVIAGIFFGLCSLLVIEMWRRGRRITKRIPVAPMYKAIMGGILLIILVLITSTTYLGLGTNTIQSALQGNPDEWYDFLLKSVFTAITLSFGGSGGVITPLFFIGSTAGAWFAQIMGLDIATFAAIGLVSILAGAAGTPIAASIMAMELFGPEIAPFAAICCVISYLITGHRSVYPSQMIAVKKSASLQLELGKEIEDVKVRVEPRETGITRRSINAAQILSNKFKKKKPPRFGF